MPRRSKCGVEVTLALDGVGSQRHDPAALPPGHRLDTHCIGGWVGPRASLDGCGKSHPHRDSIPGPSSMQRVARSLRYCDIRNMIRFVVVVVVVVVVVLVIF